MNYNPNKVVVDLSLCSAKKRYQQFKINIEGINKHDVCEKIQNIYLSCGGELETENERLKLPLTKYNIFVDKIKQDQSLMDSMCLQPLNMDTFEINFSLHSSKKVKTTFIANNLLTEINEKRIQYEKETIAYIFTLKNYKFVVNIINFKFPNCKLKSFSDGVYTAFWNLNQQRPSIERPSLEEKTCQFIFGKLKPFQKEGVWLAIEKNARLM